MSGDDLAPLIGMVTVMAVPIIAILTSHQRKMAMLIHGAHREQQQGSANNDALVNEIRELKQVVYQQAIALDSLRTEVRQGSVPQSTQAQLSNRLGQDPSATS
jgi:hypothetical protein